MNAISTIAGKVMNYKDAQALIGNKELGFLGGCQWVGNRYEPATIINFFDEDRNIVAQFVGEIVEDVYMGPFHWGRIRIDNFITDGWAPMFREGQRACVGEWWKSISEWEIPEEIKALPCYDKFREIDAERNTRAA